MEEGAKPAFSVDFRNTTSAGGFTEQRPPQPILGRDHLVLEFFVDRRSRMNYEIGTSLLSHRECDDRAWHAS